jgi:hypothetical protein
MSNTQAEADQKLKNADRDIDEFVEQIQNEMAQLKNLMVSSLNKKADFSMLDRLNELVAKKVDNEHLRQGLQQQKQELHSTMELMRNEISLERSTQTQKGNEKIDKMEMNTDRALDEIYSFKEQLRLLSEERKRDIEETADFIKQLIDNQKAEQNRDLGLINRDVETLKKDMVDRCSLKEVISLKQQLQTQLDKKIETHEVQSVLNDCQKDIGEQLSQFKQKLQDKIIAQEISLTRVIERKADHKDLKQIHDDMVSKGEARLLFVPRDEFDGLKHAAEQAVQGSDGKLNRESFVQFDTKNEERIQDILKQLQRKSNIKDVCALLDMKSNTEEVNKALDEIHEELGKSVVTKTELNDALQE